MNEDQKYQLIKQMADRIKTEFEETPLRLPKTADLTEQLVELLSVSGIHDEQKLTSLHFYLARIVLSQLGVREDSAEVENAPLHSESLRQLASAADAIIKFSSKTQAKLIDGIEVGLLRSSADYTFGEQTDVVADSFSGSLVKVSATQKLTRNLRDETFAEMTIPSSQFGTDASVNVTDTLAFEDYETVVLTSFLYRRLAEAFGQGHHPVLLELRAYSVEGVDQEENPVFNRIEMQDLEEPIFFTIPKDAGVELACSVLDEETGHWQGLNCPEEQFSETSVTCCARSFGTFGLIPKEYLEILAGTAVDLESMIPPFTMSYLIAAIAGMIAMIISCGCMLRQLRLCLQERKQYEVIAQNLENEVPPTTNADERISSPDTQRNNVVFQEEQRRSTMKSSVATDAGLLCAPPTQRGTDELEAERTS